MTRIEHADQIIGSLGMEAYRVGGSVRDELMGRKPKDADYVVRGQSLSALGGLLLNVGKISPLTSRQDAMLGWRVYTPNVGMLEVVLPRTEENAGDGRAQHIYVDPELSLAADAARRDFTFNALYKGVGEGYPVNAIEGGVIDPLGMGLHDAQHRIVRITHRDSFRDDPLRILRGLRFVSELDADLDDDTLYYMRKHADKVDGWMKGGVSGTVLDQLSKLLMGKCPARALRIARDTGVLAVALPELAPMLNFDQGSRYHDLTTDEHTFMALETAAHVNAPLRVRMALLFHDAGKPEVAWKGKDGRLHYYEPSFKQWAEINDPAAGLADPIPAPPKPVDHEVVSARLWDEAAKRLNVDKKLRNDVRALVLHHMVPTKTRNTGVRVRRMRVQFGDELLRDLLMMRACDLSGKQARVALNHIEHVKKLERLRAEAEEAGVPASVKDLEIDGEDCRAEGLEGREIGKALASILDEVVCDPAGKKLTREWQRARLGSTG